jgi:hypothetical protein
VLASGTTVIKTIASRLFHAWADIAYHVCRDIVSPPTSLGSAVLSGPSW